MGTHAFHMQPNGKFNIESLPLPEMQKAVKNYPGEHVPAIFSLPVPIVG